MKAQRFFWIMILLLCVGLLVWAISFGTQPSADFTFCNGDDIKTVDPAQASGQPEGRIISAIFEGLCRYHPETLEPLPGVATDWEISEDGLRYTFHLRKNAYWSDDTPVTAEDFSWSMRRFLHPETAAEYAFEMWYIKNSKKFTIQSELNAGDPVEVELHEKLPGARPFAAGKIIRGKLLELDTSDDASTVYVVEADGVRRIFRQTVSATEEAQEWNGEKTESCRWVLYDFQHVGIHTPDAYTVVFELEHPVPYFLTLLSFYPMSAVQRKCLETYGSPHWTKPENIVTNGPFLLESRRIRDRVRLRKNPKYWDHEHVYCETIDALAVKFTTTALNLYMTGQSDWITTVPLEVVGELKGRKDWHGTPYLGTYYYIINTGDAHGNAKIAAALGDVRVRRALSMSIDREELTEKVLQGGEIPSYNVVCDRMKERIPYQSAVMERYDPEKARELLAEAGFPGGQGFPEITIMYNTSESHRIIAELVQAHLFRNLGIRVRLQNQEWAEFLTKKAKGDFHIARAGWVADYVDPLTFLLMYTSDSPQNDPKWKNPKFDALIHQAMHEPDTRKRLKILQEAEQIMLNEVPIIPLYVNVSKQMVNPRVEGWYSNLLDMHPLKSIRVKKK
ncbi:MAG: peptide ABC transporter substrate-binding protein [Planctomycetia bacterium]|nr:peptide ABC transporter substrate-binding protein [Planctomycetia bacterium]